MNAGAVLDRVVVVVGAGGGALRVVVVRGGVVRVVRVVWAVVCVVVVDRWGFEPCLVVWRRARWGLVVEEVVVVCEAALCVDVV